MIRGRTIILGLALAITAWTAAVFAADENAKPSDEQKPAAKEGQAKSEQPQSESKEKDFIKKFFSSPEEVEKFKKLQKENPDAFRDEVKKKMDGRKAEREEVSTRTNELVEKYQKAQTDADKAKIKEELKASIKAEFDKKMDSSKQRLDHAEKQLQEFKSKYDERKKNADQIVDTRLEELLKDPKLKW